MRKQFPSQLTSCFNLECSDHNDVSIDAALASSFASPPLIVEDITWEDDMDLIEDYVGIQPMDVYIGEVSRNLDDLDRRLRNGSLFS